MIKKVHLLTVFSIISVFNNNTYATNWADSNQDYKDIYTIYDPGSYVKVTNNIPNNIPPANKNIYNKIEKNVPTTSPDIKPRFDKNIPIVNKNAYNGITNNAPILKINTNTKLENNIPIMNQNINVEKQSTQDDIDQFINDFLTGKTTPTMEYYIPPKNKFVINNLNNKKYSYDVFYNKFNNLNDQGNKNNRSSTSDADNRNKNPNNNANIIKQKVTKVYPVYDNNIVKQALISNANPDSKLTIKHNMLTYKNPNEYNQQFAKTCNNFFPNKNNVQLQQNNKDIQNNNIQILQKKPIGSKLTFNLDDIPLSVTRYINVDNPDYNTYITEVNTNKNKINAIKKIDSNNNPYIRQYSKSPVRRVKNQNNIKTTDDIEAKANKIIHKVNPNINNGITTNWKNGITPNDVNLFLKNVKDPLAYENMKMQVYSLLGENSPSFSDPERIRVLFDVIDNNKTNTDEVHIYNYDKPFALTGIFLDYYLNNIQLYNDNKDKFNSGRIEAAKKSLSFNKQEYSEAIKLLSINNFYETINKIVKGVNIVEDFSKNKKFEETDIANLNISKAKRQDWLVTTFELFNYALQYSNKDDQIVRTTFAEFVNYLKNNTKYRNIKEEIQFIPTLQSFVEQNKSKFEAKNIQSALEAIYKEEKSNIGCYGIMGSVLMFRIFPELKKIFSSNQFDMYGSILDLANKFHFSSNQSLAQQFDDQAHKVLEITKYDNSNKLFDNADYLIMVTNGLTRNTVINDRKYISRYALVDPKNNTWKLELYNLMGVQLYSIKTNSNYISIDKSKLAEIMDSQIEFSKECIEKNLQPIQALYKRITQDDYDIFVLKEALKN
ncbi:MAG: hypothetical protein IJU54_00480 [Alphaproteobacteria bacterium]|nr:hypothetical protein [Alphaproteobacteria bacterium]